VRSLALLAWNPASNSEGGRGRSFRGKAPLNFSSPPLSTFHTKMPLANKPDPKSLPPCPESFSPESDLRKAFQVCKILESKERWTLFHDDPAHNESEEILLDIPPVCAGRVLGFALLYSPSDDGRDNLAAEILGCNGDDELLGGLAHLYVYGFIRVCTLSIASLLLSC